VQYQQSEISSSDDAVYPTPTDLGNPGETGGIRWTYGAFNPFTEVVLHRNDGSVYTSVDASPCHLYESGDTIPAGFGVPWDVNTNDLLIKAICTTTTATLDLGKGNPLQYIYKTGYHYRPGFSSWQPISYKSSKQLIANNWYPMSAQASITTDTSTDNYVLGYICTWNGSTWRCGCRDAACTQSYWQVQRVQR
jgi:hypothetical protein